MYKKSIALFAVVVSTMVMASSAGAARQTGLVNVNVEDNVVQIPIAVAANICDVTVAVLAADIADNGSATCTTDADSEATVTRAQPNDRQTRQRGLINVNLQNNTIQVPIAVAANLC